MAVADLLARVPARGVADTAEAAVAGGDMRCQHDLDRGAPRQIRVANDPGAGPVVAPRSLLKGIIAPRVEETLELLRDRGAKHFVLCVGHLGEKVESHFGDGKRWGVRITYSHDGPKLLGLQQMPRLAGQQHEYLREQLRLFKAGKRGELDGNMTAAAQALGDKDIEVLADYIAGLGG